VTCNSCNKELAVGDWPFCPHGKGRSGVIPDDIPGGLEIANGLCNEDGTPRRYYSRTEIDREAKRRGYENHVGFSSYRQQRAAIKVSTRLVGCKSVGNSEESYS
jgi:hypothetical protein